MTEITKKITITDSEIVKLTEPGNYLIELTKPEATAEIFGSFSVSRKERAKIVVTIHHKAPQTLAKTNLRGVARDKAHLSFSGRIIIDEHCGGTNSFLTERILLLSDTATAEAIPDLEILSDDVKCSHAASVSSIPAEQLFYLMSRGISKFEAEKLIVDGFLQQ
ncbi:MAG: hypothetical protein COU65_04815 [Candidatus Pacebacteria bacterium CG10_big_fil_rev_8_21_14_0_10_42_12]|nr:SufD family Fe-S cluster assembly protein [Candidatus Paceibacterota bacterium]PIR62163.1 MAG: hypothetical protein COU65_04815 [Candidatus Pacebacteria bacterium CG10_big_fil_rev_8_21_14_0_10_42_12]